MKVAKQQQHTTQAAASAAILTDSVMSWTRLASVAEVHIHHLLIFFCQRVNQHGCILKNSNYENKRTKRYKNPFLLLKYWYDPHTTPANGNKCTFSGLSGQPLPGSPLTPFAALTLWSSLGLSPFQAGTHIKSRLTLSLRKWPEGLAGGAGQWQSARIGCGLHWRTTWGLPTGTWHGCRIHPGHHNRLKQFHDVMINAGQAAGKSATFNRYSAS